ncbi:hypothetical protein Dsin_009768 [Dipteronia sinensis]|uniref:SWIM-type domain-containing protein n=1 Tax=Dipteronia sinensis TaxID=43782 RepID=A0AAE0EBX9_9ROSI|nr:hypothetical protein Dsin_009768 [Dipteronia sinensis]
MKSMNLGSNMDMNDEIHSNGTGHLDLNKEGHSMWHETDTTHTYNEEYNPNDSYNNNEWTYHVPFTHGGVSTTPGLSDENLVQPADDDVSTAPGLSNDNLVQLADDLVHSEVIALQVSDIVGKEFISVTDAEDFYKNFSCGMGFSMRKDRLCRDTHGLITIRRWVCSKEGYRSKNHVERTDRIHEPRGQTREGCRASLKINFDREEMLWLVTEFANEHSHKLSPGNHNQFLHSHQNVKDCDIAQVQSLRSVGMKTSQVMDHLLDQSGSYAAVGHTRKDLQNRLDTVCRFASDNSDVDSFISYMTVKSKMDPGFYFRYTILEDGSLGNLFWSDVMLRCDYRYFGDVISFDSMYRTNSYNRLFVIFVGVNNHTITTIFGFRLLVDETVGTYTWILQTFLQAMHGKCPISVVTDGDKALSKAIRVQDEINSEEKLSIVNCVDDVESVMYTFMKFAGGDKTWNVRYTPSKNIFKCSCKMFETIGITCCHSFSVMKAMNMHHIPETLIIQRWTINAKDVSEVESSSTAYKYNSNCQIWGLEFKM